MSKKPKSVREQLFETPLGDILIYGFLGGLMLLGIFIVGLFFGD